MAAMKVKLPDDFFAREEPGLNKSYLASFFLHVVVTYPSIKILKNESVKLLHQRFMQKYADYELLSLADNTVPPADVEAVSITRSVLFKYRREARILILTNKCFF